MLSHDRVRNRLQNCQGCQQMLLLAKAVTIRREIVQLHSALPFSAADWYTYVWSVLHQYGVTLHPDV